MSSLTKEDILNHPTLCMSPWVHLHVQTEGQVLPCCMTDEKDSLGNLESHSVAEIFNGSSMKQLRKQFRCGEKPSSCSRCFELEASGAESYRGFMNKRFAKHFDKINQTSADGTAEVFLPYWDIRFSNVCNFRCRTCALPLSSSWYEDEIYLNNIHGPKIRKIVDKAPDLWQQLEPHLSQLEEVYFVGGEPLLMDEHWMVLEELVQRKLFHVRLRYNSNLSTLTYKNRDVISLWKLFRRVDVQASLDGFGERAEYMRKGQNWDQARKNWQRIRAEAGHVRMTVNTTVSVFNIFHLPDFHRQWMEQSLIEASGFLLNILMYPLFYRVQILPPEMKTEVERKIESHLQWIQSQVDSDQFQIVSTRYQSLIHFMKRENRQGLLPQFNQRTVLLDQKRKESFSQIFPEIASLQLSIEL